MSTAGDARRMVRFLNTEVMREQPVREPMNMGVMLGGDLLCDRLVNRKVNMLGRRWGKVAVGAPRYRDSFTSIPPASQMHPRVPQAAQLPKTEPQNVLVR